MRHVLLLCIAAAVCCTPAFAQPLIHSGKEPSPHRCRAHFSSGPVASWDQDGRTMTLMRPFSFIDSDCERWDVPKGAAVDGASIPQVLWSMMGGPFEGRYRDASVVHDWYCARRTRPWQAVDRMFYDGMIASGVSKWKAEAFYWAVLNAGPHWDELTIRDNNLAAAIARSTAANPGTHTGAAARLPRGSGVPPVTKAAVLRMEKLARTHHLTPDQVEQYWETEDVTGEGVLPPEK